MSRAITGAGALLLSAGLLAACIDQPARVTVRFGAAHSALQAQGVSVVLKVTQDDKAVSTDEKPLTASSGVATAALAFGGLVAARPAVFDVTVLWATHSNRVLLHASKSVASVTEGTSVDIGDGDIVQQGGKPDLDGDGASDLAEVIAGSDPDDARSKPSSGGAAVSVTVGAAGGIARFEQSLPLTVVIDKGDGTVTTDPSAATWASASSTVATVSTAGVVQAKTVIGQAAITAKYGGVTSAPVTINVQPAKIKLGCEQGTGVAAYTISYCYLWTLTSAGAKVETVKNGAWHLASSDASLLIASDPDTYNSRGVLSGQLADGPVTVTATYADGTAEGMKDATQFEVVNVTAMAITAPTSTTDISSLVYTDFPLTVTRSSGKPLPDGFTPQGGQLSLSLKYSESNVVYGYAKWPNLVSFEGMIFGTTYASLVLGSGTVTSNRISLRSIPDTARLAATSSITLAPGASVTNDVNCFSDGLHTGCYVSAATVQVSMTTSNAAVATVTWATPPPVGSAAGSQLNATIQARAAGTATITPVVNGVTGAPLSVTVGP